MPPFGKIEPEEDDNKAIVQTYDASEENPPSEIKIKESGMPESLDELLEEVPVEPSKKIEEVEDAEEINGEPSVGASPKIKKKRAVFLLLILAAIIAAAIYFMGGADSATEKTPEITEIQAPAYDKYIDDGEEENKFFKDNPEAKGENVNVFDFDINKCLQKYTDAECTDMFDKNLMIMEKK